MVGEVNPAPVPRSYRVAVPKSWCCACVSPGTRGSQSGPVGKPTGWKAACAELLSKALTAEAERVEALLMRDSSSPICRGETCNEAFCCVPELPVLAGVGSDAQDRLCQG